MKLYILEALDVRPMTEEKRKQKWKLRNARYGNTIPYDRYLDFLKDQDEYEFSLESMEELGYFVDLQNAKETAMKNVADYNDGGSYNYAVIKAVDEGIVYANCYVKEYYFYQYNAEAQTYNEISNDAPEVKFLIHNLGFIPMKKKNIELDMEKEKFSDVINEESEEVNEPIPMSTKNKTLKELISCLETQDYEKLKSIVEQNEIDANTKLNGTFDKIQKKLNELGSTVSQFFDSL